MFKFKISVKRDIKIPKIGTIFSLIDSMGSMGSKKYKITSVSLEKDKIFVDNSEEWIGINSFWRGIQEKTIKVHNKLEIENP